MNTPEQVVPATAPTPMPTDQYTAALMQHKDQIIRIGQTYAVEGRVPWKVALEKEPEVAKLLLVGPGPLDLQVKRISNAWLRLTNRRKELDKTRSARRSSTTWGKPKNYEGSLCAKFDEHRQRLEVMAQAYRTPSGAISWLAGLASSPELAQDIGYADLSTEGKRKMSSILGFWYRDRVLKGAQRRVQRQAPQRPVSDNGTPPVPAPSTGLPHFCAHCGNPIAAQVLAAQVIQAMASKGMSQQQVVEALTRASTALSKINP